jgi:2,4-dienoyl-CoA reductase-like NADH-dependent reductase (Old Yellow Enzyme family)
MAIVAPIARRTGVLQVVSAIASLKKVVDFEHACGGTIALQGNHFPRLR